MQKMLSIIFAHRNRDTERIKISFNSLRKQHLQNFEVVFVDYGSEDELVLELEELTGKFDFVKFHFLKVSQLLWNKSKALNYGIKNAKGKFIFISDIDLIFHPETTALWQDIIAPEKFILFRLGYLGEKESKKLSQDFEFKKLKSERVGDVNGMILCSKESLLKVNGFDEFFHFYGAEDEDLFARLENAGYQKEYRKEEYFYHQWHHSFLGSEGRLLTGNPRIKNIMRINNRHYQRNRERALIKPLRQMEMGGFINSERADALKIPDLNFKIPNMLLLVEHFLREELPSRKGVVIEAEFYEDSYYKSLKHKLKKITGKQEQPYISLKEVNDMVLKEILYNYRDYNYSFKVQKDLKSIILKLEI